MHDILEGSLQYKVKELLKHLVLDNSYLTLDTLNAKIQRFPYQQSDKTNKPPQIKESVLSSSTHFLKQEGDTVQWTIVDIIHRTEWQR